MSETSSKYERGTFVTPIPHFIGLIANAANKFKLFDVYELLNEYLVKSQSRTTILCYHHFWDSVKYPWRLDSITVQDFEKQIQYLSQRYKFISLDELAQCIMDKKPFPPRSVCITFDDGNKDNYINAYPILKKYNVPATIFLVSNQIDTMELFWWDKVKYLINNSPLKTIDFGNVGMYSLQSGWDKIQAISSVLAKLAKYTENKRNHLIENLEILSEVSIPENLGREHILSWDEIREMHNNGISFGSHSATHPFFTELSLAEAKSNIVDSKKRIEEELGQTVITFSYPYGAYKKSIEEILQESGFTCAVTTVPKLNTHKTDLYELGRTVPGWDFATFKFYLRLYPDLRNILAKIKNMKLINAGK